MTNLKEAHSKIVAKAKAQPGVKGLMKVYERFQEVNTVTEQYLQLVSPKTHRSNSNASLLMQ